MKTFHSGKSRRWILLALLPSSTLCAQSISATRANTDSLATATDFVNNAKNIQRDLVKLDFAKVREVGYRTQITLLENANQRIANSLASCQAANGQLTTGLATSQQQTREQALETKKARVEIWAMRAAIAIYLAAKIMEVLP